MAKWSWQRLLVWFCNTSLWIMAINIVTLFNKENFQKSSEVLLSFSRYMNNLKSNEKQWEESVMEDNGVWRSAQCKDQRREARWGNLTLKRGCEAQRNRAKQGKRKVFTGAGRREMWMEEKYKKGEWERERERSGERGEKEGQTGRWKVLWREGVFMSGCRRHSGTPSKRKSKFDKECERGERAPVWKTADGTKSPKLLH